MKGSRAVPRSVLRPAVSQSKRCFSSYSRYLSATRPTSHITSSWNNNQALYTQSNKSWMEPSKLTKRYYSSQEKVTVVPPMGDSISEGEITEIAKKTGESVEVDEVILTIETDKVAVPIRAEIAGTIAELYAAEGEVVKVGQKLFKIAEGAASAAPKQAAAPQQAAPAQQTPPQAAQAPPAQQAAPQKAAAPAPKAAPAAPAAPKAPAGEREYRVKIPRIRARVAERLKGSQNTYAMLTTFQECDMHNLMQLRDEYKEVFEKTHGVKLGFMSAFVKASAAALKAQPIVNAVMDDEAIIYRDYVDISVAVATSKGLVVPVLRDCDQMSFAQVEKTIGELGKKAKEDRITLEDMAGGTFTISNGGVYGSMMGTPIVNPPQSAILGMHGITKRAVVINDEIKIRPIMYLALTYDHRLIDGKDAVTFLRRIKHGVEDPRRLLLDL